MSLVHLGNYLVVLMKENEHSSAVSPSNLSLHEHWTLVGTRILHNFSLPDCHSSIEAIIPDLIWIIAMQ